MIYLVLVNNYVHSFHTSTFSSQLKNSIKTAISASKSCYKFYIINTMEEKKFISVAQQSAHPPSLNTQNSSKTGKQVHSHSRERVENEEMKVVETR